MKQRKVIAILAMILVLVLCVGVFAACNKEEEKFTPAAYAKPEPSIDAGSITTVLAPDGGKVTIPTAKYAGDATKDYRDAKFYTYRDYVASTQTLKWSPHTWETSEDSYILGYINSNLYEFVLNSTKDGYAIVPEMAAAYPVDVTAVYAAKYDYENEDDSASYGVKYSWDKIEKEEYDELAKDSKNTLMTDSYTFEEYLERAGVTFEQYLAYVEMTEAEYLAKVNVATKEEALAREFTDYYKKVNETNKAFRIALNPNAKWDDGTPINADTYIYSMKELLNPLAKNRRADSFYAGSFVLHNAKNYFYQGQSGIGASTDVYSEYSTSIDSELIFSVGRSDTQSYFDKYLTRNGLDPVNYMVANAGVTGEQISSLNGKTLAAIKSDKTLNAVWTTIITWWQTDPNEELHFFVSNYTYGKMDFSNVGIVKVDEYTIDFIVDNPIEQPEYYVPYNLGTNFIVKKDVYEANQKFYDEKGNTVDRDSANVARIDNSYGTNASNSPSCGPYKLTYFEADKAFTLDRNNNWHGYSDGVHYGQYQTDKISVSVIGTHATQLESFLKGDLDNIGLAATDMAKYGNSQYIRYTPESYTTKLTFNTNYDSLVQHGTNSQILVLDEFRAAFSLALDRNTFASSYTSAGKAGYGLLNYMYVYDPIQGLAYRDHEAAKAALVELYGLTYGENGDYESLDDAYNAITGYDITKARQLMQKAYDKALQLGIFRADQTATIEIRVYKDDDVYVQMFNFLNAALKKACEGTGFEGKVKLSMKADEDYYNTMYSGGTDIIFTTWGGAASSPFTLLYECYCDAADGSGNQMEYGFDTSKITVKLTVDGVDYTADFQKWALWIDDSDASCKIASGDGKSTLLRFSQYDYDTRCQFFAKFEKIYLSFNATLPLYYRNSASLVSQKGDYAVKQYVNTVGLGGIQYYTYNYDDAAWAEFVKGGLTY